MMNKNIILMINNVKFFVSIACSLSFVVFSFVLSFFFLISLSYVVKIM